MIGVYIEDPNKNSTFKLNCHAYSNGLTTSQWDQVNLVFYNVIPFILMMTFNCLLIINIRRSNSHMNHHSNPKIVAKRRNLTISLLFLSFLFLIMTVPGTFLFAYFYDSVLSTLGIQCIYLIDDISFFNNSILFFICFISNKKFRSTIIELFYCQCKQVEVTKSNTFSWEILI